MEHHTLIDANEASRCVAYRKPRSTNWFTKDGYGVLESWIARCDSTRQTSTHLCVNCRLIRWPRAERRTS